MMVSSKARSQRAFVNMSNGEHNSSSLPPELSGAAAPPQTLLRQLDPSVIKLWRLTYAITAAVLMLIASITALVLAVTFPGARIWIVAGWVALAALLLCLVLAYPPRAYRAWGYQIDRRVLQIHRGIWFRMIQLLPLSRLQHVDLHRGPLERSFGLATLMLHTAGTHYAILTIPGLAAEEAVRLRDHLVAAGGGDDAV